MNITIRYFDGTERSCYIQTWILGVLIQNGGIRDIMDTRTGELYYIAE